MRRSAQIRRRHFAAEQPSLQVLRVEAEKTLSLVIVPER